MTTRDEELRKAVFGQVDLATAELEISGAVYDGWAAAIMVRGQPRTIAMTREYSDAVQIMALIDRARSLSTAPDALRAKGEELVKALKRYGFPVSGAATVNLGAFGSSEAMAVDFTTREFIQALAALQAEQGAK